MLKSFRLRTKLAILVVVALVGTLGQVGYSVMQARQDLLEGRRQLLKSVLEGVHATLADFHARERAGALSREEAQAQAAEAIRRIRYGGKSGTAEYVYAFTTEGVGIYHVVEERIGRNMLEKIRDARGNYTWKDILATARLGPGGGFLITQTARPGETALLEKLGYARIFEPWSWVIGTGSYIDDIDAQFRERLLMDVVVAMGFMAVIGALGFSIGRIILAQVGGEPVEAIRYMSRVAGGDLSGELAQAPAGSMLASMQDTVRSLRSMVQGINEGSARLASGVSEVCNASREVSLATQQQSDAASCMAAAVEEMTVAINHIADSAHETRQTSMDSVAYSEDGFERVEIAAGEIRQLASRVADASAQIRHLENHAGQISDIAAVIKEIAGQTNLLALNAAIEAARAGEQGRGFAVVADEVRKLAERTSSATVEIDQMIQGIQSDTRVVVSVMDAAIPQVRSGVDAAEDAAGALRKIRDGAQATMSSIEGVAQATREQSAASNSIAQKVEEIATMVDQTSASMQSIVDTVTALDDVSHRMQNMVSRFRC